MEFIPLSKPSINQEEIRAVSDVIKSGWFVQGPKVKEFEEKFAEYCNTRYAAATNSGTAALHLSIKSLIPSNSEVIVPSLTFVATANTIMLENSIPVFADINEKKFTIDPIDIKNKITPKTKAIIPVHLYGQSADLDEISEIADKNNLKIIEDACQAHGTKYKNRKIGSFNTSCFSFHPMKNMICAEGGIITSNDKKLIDNIKSLRSHGESLSAFQRFQNIKKREFTIIGYNYRMNEIQAAIGLVQLKKLDKNNKKRIKLAQLYTELLSSIKEIEAPFINPYSKHIFHLYTIKAEKRDNLQEFLYKNNIASGIYYNPIHLEPAYKNFKCKLNITENICKKILSLPMFPDLTEEQVIFITEKIKEFYLFH